MNDDSPTCSCVVDTGGLHDIASATGNLKTIALDKLKQGVIAVPSWVLQELREAYPEDADEIESYVAKRITMKQSISVRAARIAEKLDTGFSKGPYDNHTGLFTAAVATNNSYRVITTESDLDTYQNMGCDACDLKTWIAELDGPVAAIKAAEPQSLSKS